MAEPIDEEEQRVNEVWEKIEAGKVTYEYRDHCLKCDFENHPIKHSESNELENYIQNWFAKLLHHASQSTLITGQPCEGQLVVERRRVHEWEPTEKRNALPETTEAK